MDQLELCHLLLLTGQDLLGSICYNRLSRQGPVGYE